MGCGKSKPAAAAPAAQPAEEKKDSLPAPAKQQPEEPKPKDTKAVVPAKGTVQIKIASAHGLRPADLKWSNKSDVFVEVCIEGKPESKITSAVVTGKAVARVGAVQGEKDSVEVELNFAGELKNFVAGDKVVFTVMDKDPLISDKLGKAVVMDVSFGGKLELEGAGEGYTAFLMVQFGEGSAMTAAIESMKDATEKAMQALAAATAAAAQETVKDVKKTAEEVVDTAQVKGSMWCGC